MQVIIISPTILFDSSNYVHIYFDKNNILLKNSTQNKIVFV